MAGATNTASPACSTRCWRASRRTPGHAAHAIIAKRLSEPVPHLSTMRAVPPAVEVAVTRALSKAPADRFPSVAEFAAALTDQLAAPPVTQSSAGRRRVRRAVAAVAGIAALVLAVAAVGKLLRQHSPAIAMQRQLTFTGRARLPAISPDGKWVAYVEGDSLLMIQELTGGQPLRCRSRTEYLVRHLEPRWDHPPLRRTDRQHPGLRGVYRAAVRRHAPAGE